MKSKFQFLYRAGIVFILLAGIVFNQATDCAENVEPCSGICAHTSSSEFNQMSRVLAGLPAEKNSQFADVTSAEQYRIYSRGIESLWQRFEYPKTAAMKKWRGENIDADPALNVFYPFSGPDIANAMIMYPDAPAYYLTGLEEPGTIPSPDMFRKKEIRDELNSIDKTLDDHFRTNFFYTLKMKDDTKKKYLDGLAPVFMIFLSRSGAAIKQASYVCIDSGGKLSRVDKSIIRHDRRHLYGIEIEFIMPGRSAIQKMFYFKVNLRNESLYDQQYYLEYLKTQGPFNNITKAAAYLMMWKPFSRIREFILANSTFIIQEDSGIPLKYFDEHEWELTFWGDYKLLDMFERCGQPDFYARMKKSSRGILPFPFGYGAFYEGNKSNLMIARKKK